MSERNDASEKPNDHIPALLGTHGEEAAAEFDCDRNLLKGIPSGRVRMILDKALFDYADRVRGTLYMTDDEIGKAEFDLQEYYQGEIADCDYGLGEEDELDDER